MRVVIIGGGFMGQLIQMLIPGSRCLDWQPKAPSVANRQFGAQYLWEPVPELRCRKFEVITGIDGEDATQDSILRYKKKVGKEQDASDWRSQFQTRMWGYQIDQPIPSNVEYGMRVVGINVDERRLQINHLQSFVPYDVLISTVPLPFLYGLIHPGRFNPQSRPIYVQTLPSQVRGMSPWWTVNYSSDETDPVYRTTVRDGEIHFEALHPATEDGWRRLIPGKIYRHPDAPAARDELAQQDIFCFGRFARWEPEELAHETLAAVRKFIASGGLG